MLDCFGIQRSATSQAEDWILKHVQDDEQGEGGTSTNLNL